MVSPRILRYSLLASFPFNLVAGYALAFPASPLGQLAGLPTAVPVAYTATLSFLVCLFGFAYAWLAVQPVVDRPLVGFAAIGKSGVFVIALVLWLEEHGSGRMVFLASGDLAFALIWFAWLVGPRAEPAA